MAHLRALLAGGAGRRPLGVALLPDADATSTPRGFLLRLIRQVERCPLLAAFRQSLRRAGAPEPLEAAAWKDPDEVFSRTVLLPLLDLPPPTKPLLIVVDALDAAKRDCQEEEERGPTAGPSKSTTQLLGSHLRLLPPWLLLVCSVRSHSQRVLRLFPGEQHPSDFGRAWQQHCQGGPCPWALLVTPPADPNETFSLCLAEAGEQQGPFYCPEMS